MIRFKIGRAVINLIALFTAFIFPNIRKSCFNPFTLGHEETKNDKMSNKDVIKNFIDEKGVSQKKICDIMKITVRTLYNMIHETGKTGISDENKEKLNKVFKSYKYGGRVK